MTYGYARCSTNESKQDIQRQVRELEAQGVGVNQIYLEYESGTRLDRPELAKVMQIIKSGDTLIATEVSRITRSTKQLCEILEFAIERKIKLVIGTFKINCYDKDGMDAMTEGMIKLMGVFAEMERNITVERIKSGLNHARTKGVRLGRPNLKFEKIPKKVIEHYPLYEDGKLNKVDYARLCGISRNALYRYLNLMEQE